MVDNRDMVEEGESNDTPNKRVKWCCISWSLGGGCNSRSLHCHHDSTAVLNSTLSRYY